jgi:carbon storage regulator CsrA
MLIITLRAGERITVGDTVVTVVKINSGKVRVGIDTPRGRLIRRDTRETRREAAAGSIARLQ